jgi:hypothetical protein
MPGWEPKKLKSMSSGVSPGTRAPKMRERLTFR